MTKEVDMRESYACWLSNKISPTDYHGIKFSRILCFEPLIKGVHPYETIGDLFRALVDTAKQFNIRSVGMPLIATGDARYR